MQKKLVGLSKKIFFFNFKFAEAECIQNSFWYNVIVYNSI